MQAKTPNDLMKGTLRITPFDDYCLHVFSVRLLCAERHPAVYDTAGWVCGGARNAVSGASCGGNVSAGSRLIMYEGQFTRHCPQCPHRLSSHSGWQVFPFKVVFPFVQRLFFFLIFFIGKLRSSGESRTVYRSVFGLRFGRALSWWTALPSSAGRLNTLYLYNLVFC